MEKDPHKVEVGNRLRAVANEFGCSTTQQLAAALGANRAQVDTWLNGKVLPPTPYAIRLCEMWGITLDWLFRGVADGMKHGDYVRIMARLEGLTPPSVEAEPEPAASKAKGGRKRASANAA